MFRWLNRVFLQTKWSIFYYVYWGKSITINWAWCRFFFPGCLNGGGQIRPGDGETPKELISRLDELYNSLRLYYNFFIRNKIFYVLSLCITPLAQTAICNSLRNNCCSWQILVTSTEQFSSTQTLIVVVVCLLICVLGCCVDVYFSSYRPFFSLFA